MRTISSIALLLFSVASLVVPASPAMASDDCTDYFLIGARGTNAAPQGGAPYDTDQNQGMGPEAFNLLTELTTKVEAVDKTIEGWGLRYPATGDVAGEIATIPNTAYTASVDEGERSFVEKFEDVLDDCPSTEFVIVGYSQGAEAVAQGIAQLTSAAKAKIVATVLFGDPMFNGSDRVANRDTFDAGHNGLFGRRDLWSTQLSSPVFSYCGHADVVCNSRGYTYLLASDLHPMDYPFVQGWANEKWAGTILGEHEKYAATVSTRAALTVAKTLGATCGTSSASIGAFLSGPSVVRKGEPVVFSGMGSLSSDCDERSWRWYVMPESPSNGLNRSSFDDAVLGTDAYLDTSFDEPGYYKVRLVSEGPGGEEYAQTSVLVLPAASSAPSSSLLTRSETLEGDLLLAWTESPGSTAELFVVEDPAGNAIESLVPVSEAGIDGLENFEYVVRGLGVLDSREYTISAINSLGHAGSRMGVQAADAIYEQLVWQGPVPAAGGLLTLTGFVTPELEKVSRDSATAPLVAIGGPYNARLITSNRFFDVDMLEVESALTVEDGQWVLELDLGEALDQEGELVANSMRHGFASDLFDDGVIEIDAGETEFAFAINDLTQVDQTNEFVINTDISVPDGVPADEYFGSGQSWVGVTHDGVYDDGLFPAFGETPGAATFDWSEAEVSDVRTFSDGLELVNTGQIQIAEISDPSSTSDSTLDIGLYGLIGDGSYLTMQSLFEHGAISFRVNGGEPNVIELNASHEVANSLFPAPSVPVFAPGDAIAAFEGEYFEWAPSIDWGGEGYGSYSISADDLPAGVVLQPDAYIGGTPLETGTFQIVVTASNSLGSATQAYELTVGSHALPASTARYVHKTTTNGVTSGAELTLSGAVSSTLAEILATTPSITPVVTGQYLALLIPTGSEPISYSMDGADVTFDETADQWQVGFKFGETSDSNQSPVWQSMRGGFATALLSGGTIELQVDGIAMTIAINETTVTDEKYKFVLDPDATVPEGVPASGFGVDLASRSISYSHDGAYDIAKLPMWGEVEEPGSFDWTTVEITDVRYFVDGQQMVGSGELSLWLIDSPDSTSSESLFATMDGIIGDGEYQSYRAFLEEGTIAFRVNGGGVNVLNWAANAIESVSAVPTPNQPVILGGATVELAKYDPFSWMPQFDWGGLPAGSYSLDAPDGLPLGVQMIESGGMLQLSGTPLESKEWLVRVSATTYMGTATRDILFKAWRSFASVHLSPHAGNISRNIDGTIKWRYLEFTEPIFADNANIIRWLPSVVEANLSDGAQETFIATDVHLYLATGAEIPITGTFTLRLVSGVDTSTGAYEIVSTDMTIGDNLTSTVEAVARQATRLTFRRDAGEVNEIWKPAYPGWNLGATP